MPSVASWLAVRQAKVGRPKMPRWLAADTGQPGASKRMRQFSLCAAHSRACSCCSLSPPVHD